MFGSDRTAMRRVFTETWRKMQTKRPLDTLEQQVARVLEEHPEYHRALGDPERALNRDYSPETGEVNPFLHLSLHLGLREQIATDRPAGIRDVYRRLSLRGGSHAAEHLMMDQLAEALWAAQRNGRTPDEQAYLEALRRAANTEDEDLS